MGIYSALEDRWYSLLDKVDSKIPVYKIIDPIDDVFPSFILFIILLIMVLLFLVFALTNFGPTYQVEITVLSVNNIPLKDAIIKVSADSFDNTFNSNQYGKISFETSNIDLLVNISKKDYRSVNDVISANKSNHTFKLSPIPLNPDNNNVPHNVMVTDVSNNVLTNATIDVLCDGKTKNTLSNQTTTGFLFELPNNCELIQLRAINFGFETKTITLNKNDERTIIKLNKIINEATVLFKVTNEKKDILKDAEIIIKDEFGSIKKTLISNIQGETETKLEFGKYSYVATYFGKSASNDFEIDSKNFKDIEIIIEGAVIIDENDDTPSSVSKIRDIAFEIINTLEEPIFNADITIFKDGNSFSTKKTTANGKTSPIKTTVDDESKYVVIVNANGYELKIVDVVIQQKGEFQKIILSKSTTDLKIFLVNDLGQAEKNGIVRISNTQFKDPIITKTTDNNGSTIINNLGPGNYTIFAIDYSKKIEATREITIQRDSNLEIVIVLVTGSGKMRYSFINILESKENSVLPDNNFFIKINDEYIVSDKLIKKTSFFETDSLIVGLKNKTITNDTNFFKKESFEYEVMRGTQTKTVYLKEFNSLPNDNKLQLFLDQIYNNNPINSISESKTNRIIANQEYYFLFDLIVNNDENGDITTLFGVDNNNVFIEDVISINDYFRIMVPQLPLEETNWASEETRVDEKAKQARLELKNIFGKIAVPIIVKISVDANATGNFKILFSSDMGDKNSLKYEKEFEIGKIFCTTDCPTFGFNNSIIQGTTELIIPETERLYLFNGEEYKLKTIITNLSDKDFGQINLVSNIDSKYFERISFTNDSNFSKQNIILPSLSNSLDSNSNNLETKGKVGTFEIKQKLFDLSDVALPQKGNDNVIRLGVRNKEEIIIDVYPEQLEPGVEYPLLLIKTKYKTGAKAITNWKIQKLVGEDRHEIGEGYFGTTDGNGIATLNFKTIGLDANDELIFTAENDEAIPSEKIIKLKNSFETISLNEPQTCINISSNTTDNIFYLEKEDTATFNITEICGQEKRIGLVSDLPLTEIDFVLQPNTTRTITLTATPKDNVLGVYPIRIFDKSLIKEAGTIDIVIKDSNNCFELEQAIFDFKNTDIISSKINNNCFSGRKDNFYPKMDISTNTVSLDYKKPGIPDDFNLNIKVMGSAIEAIVYGFGWGTYMLQVSSKGKSCGTPTGTASAPEALNFIQEGTDNFTNFVERLIKTEMGERPETEFDELGRPTTTVVENNLNELKENKGKIKFDNAVSGETMNYYPSRIGDIEAEPGGCQLKHSMDWVGAPRPPGYDDGISWNGVTESPLGELTVMLTKDCNPCKIDAFALNYESGTIDGILYTRGKDIDPWIVAGIVAASMALGPGALWWGYNVGTALIVGGVSGGIGGIGAAMFLSPDRAKLGVQPEFYRAVGFVKEQQNFWSKEQTIIPSEGTIHDLGTYISATPIPKWTNETSESEGKEEVDEESGITKIDLGVAPLGFLPQEVIGMFGGGEGIEGEEGYEIKSSIDPKVEADPSGLIYYSIVESTIPKGVNAWLRNGRLYAEYIGEPEVPGKNIDFNITKNNLFGEEYAIITIADWTTGEEKTIQKFQIKLIGQANSCVSKTGVQGVTGKDFAPRLNFNWDWSNIKINDCDNSNADYQYCDATQFNISLFKKLYELDLLLKQNAFNLIPQKTVFYSYLIKDNYSKNFLDDFEKYYSNEFIGAEAFFIEKYNRIIKNDKIEFRYNRQAGQTELPYGGLYRIEISIEKFDEGISSLFDIDEPVKNIVISIVPIYKAPNYNPFYDTPINGLVGKIGETYKRDGYGVSFQGESIRFNENVTTNTFDSAPVTITTQKISSLEALNDGVVLIYDKTSANHTLTLKPSQPNPIVMLVDNNKKGELKVSYVLEGTLEKLQKKWDLVGSTIGTTKCLDLSNNDKQDIVETSPGKLVWNNAKIGKNWLATTFFTPSKGESAPIRMNPISPSLTLYSIVPLNQKQATLDYFDTQGIIDYDTIKGIFNRIQSEQMCVSKDNENKIEVWWNPEYLNELIDEINPAKGKACN